RRDVAGLHGGHDAGEGVARRGVRDLLVRVAPLPQLDREGGQIPPGDQPPARLVAVRGDLAAVGPAPRRVGADAQQPRRLADRVALHAAKTTRRVAHLQGISYFISLICWCDRDTLLAS